MFQILESMTMCSNGLWDSNVSPHSNIVKLLPSLPPLIHLAPNNIRLMFVNVENDCSVQVISFAQSDHYKCANLSYSVNGVRTIALQSLIDSLLHKTHMGVDQ